MNNTAADDRQSYEKKAAELKEKYEKYIVDIELSKKLNIAQKGAILLLEKSKKKKEEETVVSDVAYVKELLFS